MFRKFLFFALLAIPCDTSLSMELSIQNGYVLNRKLCPHKIPSLEKMSFKVFAAPFRSAHCGSPITNADLLSKIPLHIKQRLIEKLTAKSPALKALLLHDARINDGSRGSLPIQRICDNTYVCPRPVAYLYMDKNQTITPEVNESIVTRATEEYEYDSYFSYLTQPHLERLFTIHCKSHTIAAWNTTSGQLVHRWATSLEPYRVQVKKNRIASLLIQYRDYDTEQLIIDNHIGYGDMSDNGIFKQIAPFGGEDAVSKFIFDAGGDYLICGSKQGALVVWDIDADSLMAGLPNVNAPAITALSSVRGLQIASGCQDGLIRLWNPLKNVNQMLKGHTGAVQSVQFNTAGDLLLSSSEDKSVRLWSVVLAQCLHMIKTAEYPIMHITFEQYPFGNQTVVNHDLGSCQFVDEDTVIQLDAIHSVSPDGQHQGKTSYKHILINKDVRKDLSALSLEQICLLQHVGWHLLKNTPLDLKDSNTMRDLYRKLPERLKVIIKKKVSWSDWMWMNYEDTKARLLPA